MIESTPSKSSSSSFFFFFFFFFPFFNIAILTVHELWEPLSKVICKPSRLGSNHSHYRNSGTNLLLQMTRMTARVCCVAGLWAHCVLSSVWSGWRQSANLSFDLTSKNWYKNSGGLHAACRQVSYSIWDTHSWCWQFDIWSRYQISGRILWLCGWQRCICRPLSTCMARMVLSVWERLPCWKDKQILLYLECTMKAKEMEAYNKARLYKNWQTDSFIFSLIRCA